MRAYDRAGLAHQSHYLLGMLTQAQIRKHVTSPAIRSATLTQDQITAAARWSRQNLLGGLCAQKKTFTIGWGAAFVQFGRLHIVQRAHLSNVRGANWSAS